ncbi:hypothetical protein COO91_10465 (plasmid) [Nostoc flagelliforme CCNUN1]|uniref:Uncharacterized protein n=1 Tax=Nostoc flagelliforme CCNUN1 TaxID=2038116 RepID=A0A2K8T990_9NOSO|nr:hypothetical protein COO91_10465 [Nostoc flagelliforme CCNUN1]
MGKSFTLFFFPPFPFPFSPSPLPSTPTPLVSDKIWYQPY